MQSSSVCVGLGLTLGDKMVVKWPHFTEVVKHWAKVTSLPVAFAKTEMNSDWISLVHAPTGNEFLLPGQPC